MCTRYCDSLKSSRSAIPWGVWALLKADILRPQGGLRAKFLDRSSTWIVLFVFLRAWFFVRIRSYTNEGNRPLRKLIPYYLQGLHVVCERVSVPLRENFEHGPLVQHEAYLSMQGV